MKKLNYLSISLLIGLLMTACNAAANPAEPIATTGVPTVIMTPTPAAAPGEPTTLNPTTVPTLVPTANPPSLPTEPTAVPNTDDLLVTVQNTLPTNAFEGLAVLPLYLPEGERPLWVVHSKGFRNFDIDPVPGHFVAIYTWQNNNWQELAYQALNDLDENNFGPDYIYEQGVTQVGIDPAYLWLAIDGGVGAHGGIFQLLRFDGTALRLEVMEYSASPGLGYLEDLNGDGTTELILRLHDFYVFCYACGVRYLNFGVYTWNTANQQMQAISIQPMPLDQQEHPAYFLTNWAVALAEAGLWAEALDKIESAEQIATEASTPYEVLSWDAALIRLYNQAYQAELNHTPYPLLTNIFYGDYAAALDIMRPYGNAQPFSTTSPLVQGTVAEGNEKWLAEYILRQTNAAISTKPDLLAPYYLRAWATFLVNPADPQITADLQFVAALQPSEPLYTQAVPPIANRIQFAPGATAATLTGQLGPQGIDIHVLAAQAGQQMSVMLTTPDDAARITVKDSQGNYLNGQRIPTFWQGGLPETGDYVIRVYGGETAPAAGSGQAVAYTLQIIIPQRITFAPGAISATIEGDVAAHESDDYILAAQAGQTMTVNITSPNSNVLLTLVGADGIPLTNGLMSGATGWQGQLPVTQDYTVRAIGTLEPATYTLTVTIE